VTSVLSNTMGLKSSLIHLAFWLAFGFGLISLVFSLMSFKVSLAPNYCQMTFMQQTYASIPVPSAYSFKYQLHLYREGYESFEQLRENKFKTSGIPVLFIPGNAGDYKQARSIASVSAKLYRDFQHRFGANSSAEYDFYTTDFRSELTGLNGFLLQEQTQFVNDCIRAILRRYSHLPNSLRPQSVLLIGHSMGGLIASAVFNQNNYHPNSVSTIITLNTPHNQHPFLYRKSIKDFYDSVNEYLHTNANSTLKDLVMISIGGSFRDQMIDSALTNLQGVIPISHGFSTLTTSIPDVWVQADHQCIVWCKQLMIKLGIILVELIDPHTHQVISSRNSRLEIFEKNLFGSLPGALGLIQPESRSHIPQNSFRRFLNWINQPTEIHLTINRPEIYGSVKFPEISPLESEFVSVENLYQIVKVSQNLPPYETLRADQKNILFKIPTRVQEQKLHFVFFCDTRVESYQVFLVDKEFLHSENLISFAGSNLPSTESFIPFDSLPKNNSQKSHYSMRSMIHLSPLQLSTSTYIFFHFKPEAPSPNFYFSEFYQESGSVVENIKEPFWQHEIKLEKNHPALVNISLPIHDRHHAYIAEIRQISEGACLFAPLTIQYRSALQEQHYHHNPTVIPIRFHVSSPSDHKLILLSDPQCAYQIVINYDLPHSIASVLHSYANVAVAAAFLTAPMTYIVQFYVYARTGVFQSFYKNTSTLLGMICCSLLILNSIPSWVIVQFLRFVQEFFGAEYFDFHVNISVGWFSVIVLVGYSFTTFVCFGFEFLRYIVGQLIFRLPFFHSGIFNNRGKLFLFVLACVISWFSTVIFGLAFAMGYYFVHHAHFRYGPSHFSEKEKQSIMEYQLSVLGFVVVAILDSIPSTIQFFKSVSFELRHVDDQYNLLAYSTIFLVYSSCIYRVPKRTYIPCLIAILTSLCVVTFGLVSFYRLSWFLAGFAISLLLLGESRDVKTKEKEE